VNIGELADFMAGWALIDICKDDKAKIDRKEELKP
jgi:hypothetical protein